LRSQATSRVPSTPEGPRSFSKRIVSQRHIDGGGHDELDDTAARELSIPEYAAMRDNIDP
jgi:hypothetical protein